MLANNETKLIVLLGNPVDQSYSTHMHNAVYEKLGINAVFLAEKSDSGDMEAIVKGLKKINMGGVGITKPNKVEIMKYLDGFDPLCEKIGSCNTVVIRDGKWIGYNTDAIGFYNSIVNDGKVNVKKSTFFIMGAGGVSRAMCAALAQNGAKKIYLTDYFEEASLNLADEMNKKFSQIFEKVAYNDFSKTNEADVIVNASGIGMGHTIGHSPIPKQYIRSNMLCYDACYNPDKTQFLVDAETQGARTLNGKWLFIRQGAEQVRLWYNVDAPIMLMAEVVDDILNHRG